MEQQLVVKSNQMRRWLSKIVLDLKRKNITSTKIREAYLERDSKYLKKAYKNGRVYLKRMAVYYIGEIVVQDNFDFLIDEMYNATDIQVKSYLYLAICNILSNGKIKLDKKTADYLNQNAHLLDNIGVVNEKSRPPISKPIQFVKKDYLKMLEDMKEKFSSLG